MSSFAEWHPPIALYSKQTHQNDDIEEEMCETERGRKRRPQSVEPIKRWWDKGFCCDAANWYTRTFVLDSE